MTGITISPRTRKGAGIMVGMLAMLLLVAVWFAAGQNNPAGAQASTVPADGRYTYANLADEVLPSVVTVYVKRDMKNDIMNQLSPEDQQRFEQFRKFFDNPQMRPFLGPMIPGMPEGGDGEESPFIAQTSGSGVIISEDGYIITNWHVVGDAEDKADLRVMLYDETEIKGADVKLVFSHQLTDLAVLKIEKTGLKPIRWGNSDDLRIGERVAAIGSPLDLRATITQGIICAKHRSVDGMSLGDMIQTDAVINPGSSGGALVNLEGQLVGINRLITTNTGRWQGYGFAIPANDAKRFADEVIASGKIAYGYIGITMASEMEDTPKMRSALGIDKDAKGVLVTNITKDSPAEKAGVQVYDFVTAINDLPVNDNDDLLRAVARSRIGDKITLKLMRADKQGSLQEKLVKVEIAERPNEQVLAQQMRGRGSNRYEEPKTQEEAPANLGLRVETYNQDGVKGLRILNVAPNSAAAKAGLQEGDVLLNLNRVALSKPDDLADAIKRRAEGKPHFLQLMRDGRSTLTTIEE